MRRLDVALQPIEFLPHIGAGREQRHLLRDPLLGQRWRLSQQPLKVLDQPSLLRRGLVRGLGRSLVAQRGDFAQQRGKGSRQTGALGPAGGSKGIERLGEAGQDRGGHPVWALFGIRWTARPQHAGKGQQRLGPRGWAPRNTHVQVHREDQRLFQRRRIHHQARLLLALDP